MYVCMYILAAVVGLMFIPQYRKQRTFMRAYMFESADIQKFSVCTSNSAVGLDVSMYICTYICTCLMRQVLDERLLLCTILLSRNN
jgi:hypothetical protein